MCCKESFIVFVYLAGMLIQNDRVFAQHSNDPCLYHDVMDSVAIVRYANSITGPSCPGHTVHGGWYRFGTTGVGEITTSCPTGNQCGGGNRIWINGSVPVHSNGIHSRVACAQKGSSCCFRALQVSMKSCGSYYIYNIGQFPACSSICLAQSTAIGITHPTPAATMITQNTVTTSSMTSTYPTEATEKDTSLKISIVVAITVGVVVIILALLAVFVIPVLRRRGQQDTTCQASYTSPTSNDYTNSDNIAESNIYQALEENRLEERQTPPPSTYPNPSYSGDENQGRDTHDPATGSNMDKDSEDVYQEISPIDNTKDRKASNRSLKFGSDAISHTSTDSVPGCQDILNAGSDSSDMVNTQLSINVDGRLMDRNDRSK